MKKPSISIQFARIQLSDITDAAFFAGEQTIITKNGKPRAKIVPLTDKEFANFEESKKING